MNTSGRARGFRGPLRVIALTCAGLMSGTALLLSACSPGSSAGSASLATPGRAAAAPSAASSGFSSAAQAAQLALSRQSIIYTANLTIRTQNVTVAADRATGIVTAAGGYVSSEQSSINPADRARSLVTLQLKIPVTVYPSTLRTLSAVLGTQTALAQHARDVTGQVADVTSRVTSAQDAITQLQALLKRAGTVSSLLSVQEQINNQEAGLEALQAQQRALARETSYATVSVTLLGQHRAAAAAQRKSRGFLAGLGAGWRGLRLAFSWLLTVLGTVLPFALVVIAVGAAGYAARRPLRRLLRRGSRPTTAG
ncbi:MAG TPA: DUF4349 domain-containing protein [Streptosporangiaceae bacterium]